MEKLYTSREAAEYLRIHVETLRRYIREGRLMAVKVGARKRVRESALEDFLKKEA